MISLMSDALDGEVTLLDPIEGITAILNRASMTGTNKLGLLLALLDIAPHRISNNRPITKEELAERILEIHWGHARPFWNVQLRQSSVNKLRSDNTHATDTSAMLQIHRLRSELEAKGYGGLKDRPLGEVKQQVGGLAWWKQEWKSASRAAEQKIWGNPVQLLQKLPESPQPFLYDIVGKEIRLLPGVAEKLTEFSDQLREAIELKFAEKVAVYNADELRPIFKFQIHEHLFGRDSFKPTQSMIEDLIDKRLDRMLKSDPQLAALQSLHHSTSTSPESPVAKRETFFTKLVGNQLNRFREKTKHPNLPSS